MKHIEMKTGLSTACVKSACPGLEVEKWRAAALVAQETGSNLKDILLPRSLQGLLTGSHFD